MKNERVYRTQSKMEVISHEQSASFIRMLDASNQNASVWLAWTDSDWQRANAREKRERFAVSNGLPSSGNWEVSLGWHSEVAHTSSIHKLATALSGNADDQTHNWWVYF